MKKSIFALGVAAFALAGASSYAGDAKTHCSLATLNGTLAWSGTTLHLNATPSAGSGFEYYDGHGHMKYYEQYSDGTTSAIYSGTGTYTLTANCIATVVYDGVQPWTYFVAPDGGRYYYSNTLDTGGISAGKAEKVSEADLVP
jgi:hypothetical protein